MKNPRFIHINVRALIYVFGLMTLGVLTISAQDRIKRFPGGNVMSVTKRIEAREARREVRQRAESVLSASEADSPVSPLFYSGNEKPFGRNFEDFLGDWVQYAMALPEYATPEDEANNRSIPAQHGPVWFLAPGQFSDPNLSEREITVPANTAIAFPVGWSFGFLFENDPDEEIENLNAFADGFLQFSGLAGEVELDYQVLPASALVDVKTSVVPVSFPYNNFLFKQGVLPTPNARSYSRSIAAGKFVILKPLPVGTHVIRYRGSFPGYAFQREFYLCVTK